MLDSMMRKIFGTKQDRDMRALKPTLDKVNSLEALYKAMSDSELQSQTTLFKEKLKNNIKWQIY